MSIVLRFFPNGEFTQGVNSSRSRKKAAKHTKATGFIPLTKELKAAYLCHHTSCDDTGKLPLVSGQKYESVADQGIYTYLCEDTQGHHFAYESDTYVLEDVIINEPIGRLIAKGELIPLVYQSVESSSASSPSRKRLETMTKNMARNIRQGCYLLEQMYSKDNLSFLTLTLPNISTDELAICCDRWQDMTDYLLVWLRKKLHKLGIEFEYVYCTEIQTKRLKHNKEYAPHLHIVFRGRYGKKYPWAITPKAIRKAWAKIIAGVIGHDNFITDALENLQRIKKSASRYLSKYMSKGNCSYSSTSPDGHKPRIHTQWGGMARKLSRTVKRCTTYIESPSHDNLGVRIIREMPKLIEKGLVKYYKEGYIPLFACSVSGVERVLKVGSGCLSTPTFEGGLVSVIQSVYADSLLQ